MILELLQFIAAILIGFFLVVVATSPRSKDIGYLGVMVAYHFALALVFYYITLGEVTDSHNYFLWSEEGYPGYIGTGFVVFLVGLARSVTGGEYFSALLFFSTLSVIGIASIYVALSKLCRSCNTPGATIFLLRAGLLLPGLHFWSAPIGKDALIVFSYGLLVIGLFGGKGVRWAFVAAALLIGFLVRPHVGGCAILIILLYVIRYVMPSNNAFLRLLLSSLMIILVGVLASVFYVFFLGFIQKYSGGGFDSLGEFLSSRHDIYAETGSGFDSSKFSFPVRYILFFLGGMPWAIGNALQFVAILEGLCVVALLLLTVRQVVSTRDGAMKSFSLHDSALRNRATYVFYYAIVMAGILSLVSGNFGLIVRQRVMVFLPLLVAFIVISALHYKVKNSHIR